MLERCVGIVSTVRMHIAGLMLTCRRGRDAGFEFPPLGQVRCLDKWCFCKCLNGTHVTKKRYPSVCEHVCVYLITKITLAHF